MVMMINYSENVIDIPFHAVAYLAKSGTHTPHYFGPKREHVSHCVEAPL